VSKVGSGTLASRVLGFVRDVVIARTFGASVGADAFFVAFRIPNFLRRLFAEGAFSQAFVPVLSEYREQRSHAEVRELAAHVAGALGGTLALVTLAGVAAAPVLALVFAPGFVDEPYKFGLTVEMVRITFPYIAFVSLASFAAGVLNTYGRFGAPAFTPVLLNVCLIGAALVVAPRLDEPIVALAWGVLAAGVVQLAFLVPFVARLRLLAWPRWSLRHAGVRRILRLMAPAVFGASVAQVNLLVDTLIASFLVTGSISWLYYSDRMVEFPLGVLGVALGTVILPGLSGDHAKGSRRDFSRTLDWALRWVVVIALPAAVGLAALAGPILATLFAYGEFGGHDVEMARRSLVAYSGGLLGFIAVKVLAPGYFARQDTRTPVRVGLVAMGVNVVLNLALVLPLAHAGLALATSIAAFVNAALLYRGLRADGIHAPEPGWGALLARVALANAVLALALLLGHGDLADWLAAEASLRATRLAGLVGGGAVLYALVLLASGLRPRHLALSSGA
jgi:putative peptidoglycan lipid II flippase